MIKKRVFVCVAVLAAFLAGSNLAHAMVLETGAPPANSGPAIPSQVAGMPVATGGDVLIYGGVQGSQIGAFNIVINPGPTLAGNLPALAAFNRAAGQWEDHISDPILVTIDADMANMGSPTIIGSTGSVVLVAPYTMFRDPVVADAGDEPDDGIVASMPTAVQYGVALPVGIGLDGKLGGTKANLKALGFLGLDAQFGVTDATITFNTGFAFDYDNSNGVTPGTMDFETVAAHELGHALGFISSVDYIDFLVDQGLTDYIAPRILDLFRFDNDGAFDPGTAAEFTTMPRSMVPGNDEITDQISPWGGSDVEVRMSTGSTQGDGRQASHWKDFLGLGLMDPTLSYGTVVPVSENDLRAFDLIGYEIDIVPEPATMSLLALGAMALVRRRRRA